jgi:hypothetical protein
MAAITLRNLPRGVARAIREKARRERLSLNKAVIGLLEEATGAAPRGPGMPGVNHDLDRFFGAWTEEEADAFDEALREQRSVELEMWR